MSDSPYFQSANAQIDTSKKGLLDAVAQAGTAGKAAFDAAQAQIAQQKQDAVARAAQRSALGIGGNNDTFLSSYDARAGQLGSNQAGFQAGLAQTQASGDSYLEKARGGMGALEAVNINKGVDAETKIKLAIQAAQAKAQAAAQAQAAQDARANEAANRADARAARSSAAADARAAATKAAKDPTFDQLIAGGKLEVAANPVNKARLDTGNILGAVTENPDVRMARLAGRDMGYSPLQIGTVMTPAKTNSYVKAVTPIPTPDEKWLVSNVRGMDATKAKQALAAPEFHQAGDLASMLAGATINPDGTLAGTDPGMDASWAGLTPRQALVKWIGAQPGNLSMKAAVDQYYGTQLDQFTKK
jgi:hypothetical protein